MPSWPQALARSSKACAGERNAWPDTATVQERDAARTRAARSSGATAAIVGGLCSWQFGWVGLGVVGRAADLLPLAGLGELTAGVVEGHLDRGHAEQQVRRRVVAPGDLH